MNTLHVPRNVVLAYRNGGAVGCGAVSGMGAPVAYVLGDALKPTVHPAVDQLSTLGLNSMRVNHPSGAFTRRIIEILVPWIERDPVR